MIAIPGNLRVWMATGHTDVRRGFLSLALMVQEGLKPRSSLMSRARLCS
jgi:transposase